MKAAGRIQGKKGTNSTCEMLDRRKPEKNSPIYGCTLKDYVDYGASEGTSKQRWHGSINS
jgi:hypothetical protein